MKPTASMLALIALFSTEPSASASPLRACEAQLKPLEIVQPSQPPQDRRVTDSFREGELVVSFVVSAEGLVVDPALVSARWTRRGKLSDGPEDYDRVVLAAISRWRYPPRAAACLNQTSLAFHISKE